MSHQHLCPACQEKFECTAEGCDAHVDIYCLDCYGIALDSTAA